MIDDRGVFISGLSAVIIPLIRAVISALMMDHVDETSGLDELNELLDGLVDDAGPDLTGGGEDFTRAQFDSLLRRGMIVWDSPNAGLIQ